jgi:hypothetical protein
MRLFVAPRLWARRQHDEFPDDVREIAERLRDGRATFSPLEFDGLRARIGKLERPPLPRRRLAHSLRTRSAAALLAMGLMLTSGAGVVIASSSLSGGSHTFSNLLAASTGNAADCQYHAGRTDTHTIRLRRGHEIVHIEVIITFDCRHVVVHIGHANHSFKYWFDDGHRHDAFGHFTGNAPSDAKTWSVKIDNVVHTYSVRY